MYLAKENTGTVILQKGFKTPGILKLKFLKSVSSASLSQGREFQESLRKLLCCLFTGIQKRTCQCIEQVQERPCKEVVCYTCTSCAEQNPFLQGFSCASKCPVSISLPRLNARVLSTVEIAEVTLLPLNTEDLDKRIHKKGLCCNFTSEAAGGVRNIGVDSHLSFPTSDSLGVDEIMLAWPAWKTVFTPLSQKMSWGMWEVKVVNLQ